MLNHFIRDSEIRFRNAFDILEQAIEERAFPGASVAIVYRGEIALAGLGRQRFNPESPGITPFTVFDLASVSKAVATTTAAAILYERGKLDLDRTVPSRPDLTIRSLLTHTSGLPAYVKLFEQTRDRTRLLELAYATPLEAPPGTRTEYSDIGFIILGDVLEKIAGETFNQFCQREIFDQLNLRQTRFCPPPDWRSRCVPTRHDDYFRHKVIQGEVNDENCWVMNGVAGHAGVFSSAADVSEFVQIWMGSQLNESSVSLLKPETVALFTRQQPGTTRALGWDRPTSPSSSGQYFSPESYGHLGFTGTSLWIDPSRELAIVLLTNRTWPDAKNQAIKQVRPRFHDAVVEALSKPFNADERG